MKQSKFSEERIAYILRQAESGTSAVEVCEAHYRLPQAFHRRFGPNSFSHQMIFTPKSISFQMLGF